MKSIYGKQILITGASTGIGKSTAILLASTIYLKQPMNHSPPQALSVNSKKHFLYFTYKD